MLEIGDLAIEPQMNSRDRRSFERAQRLPQRFRGRGLRNMRDNTSNGHRHYHEIKSLFASWHQQFHIRKFRAE